MDGGSGAHSLGLESLDQDSVEQGDDGSDGLESGGLQGRGRGISMTISCGSIAVLRNLNSSPLCVVARQFVVVEGRVCDIVLIDKVARLYRGCNCN